MPVHEDRASKQEETENETDWLCVREDFLGHWTDTPESASCRTDWSAHHVALSLGISTLKTWRFIMQEHAPAPPTPGHSTRVEALCLPQKHLVPRNFQKLS